MGVVRVAVRAEVKVVSERKVIVHSGKRCKMQVDCNTTESIVRMNVVVKKLGINGVLEAELQTQ